MVVICAIVPTAAMVLALIPPMTKSNTSLPFPKAWLLVPVMSPYIGKQFFVERQAERGFAAAAVFEVRVKGGYVDEGG